ncbi:PEGA domain-containing protein [Candidatus Woesebacteria bacterium]|nr:PEGA domain-containing protein [Candidatus Woesebacteria bacterium]
MQKTPRLNKRVFFTLLSAVVIVVGTVIAIRFAQGYRPTKQGVLSPTGLLSANSFPNGASVYIDGNLTTATDATLNLPPGDYDVEIKKDGYSSWKKSLRIDKELVTQTNAMLFPSAPSLSALTSTGATNITPSPDGQQLLYVTASASAERANGIYVMSLADSPLALQKGATQIARTPTGWDLSAATFVWSPDGSQILLSYQNRNLLLTANRMNELESTQDVSLRRRQILDDWMEIFARKREATLRLFPAEVVRIATQSATAVYLSPDQERLLYTATAAATLSQNLIPALPAANSQPQERTLVPGTVYVYDRHEDRNFAVARMTPPPATATPAASLRPSQQKTATLIASPSATPTIMAEYLQYRAQTSPLFVASPQWLPDSKHIITSGAKGIEIVEYDGTNRTTVYAGPFTEHFVYPWPNGSKLIILTNFNQSESAVSNLYAISLR